MVRPEKLKFLSGFRRVGNELLPIDMTEAETGYKVFVSSPPQYRDAFDIKDTPSSPVTTDPFQRVELRWHSLDQIVACYCHLLVLLEEISQELGVDLSRTGALSH